MMTAKVVRKKVGKGAAGLTSALGGPKRVKVGFPAGKTGGEIVKRAIWNHFGTRRGIPERPFLTNAMRANRDSYGTMMKVEARNIILGAAKGQDAGKAKRQALRRLGIKAQGDIQAEITSLSSPPNAPSTIRQKGSSNPLIDSGEMRAATTWKIVE